MSTDRFERELPDLLTQLAPRAVPDYRDDIVRKTARMRQRPAWTIPERWIPMASITSRLTATPNVQLRLIALAALLIAALIVGGVLIASSRPRVPAPFGPAANGLIAYEEGGDIYLADPVTGVATAIVTGIDQDLRPVFSRDGTRIVFERKETGSSGRLIVVRSDGSAPIVVTPEPVTGLDYPWAEAVPSYAFSPDGTEIALWSTTDAGGKLWIAQADGNGMRQVELPFIVVEAAYRPPNGAELVVAGSTDGQTNGIYAIDTRTGTRRTIVAPTPGVTAGFGVGLGRFSPDGSRLAYVTGAVPDTSSPSSWRVHVIGMDGSHDVTLPMPAGAVFQDAPAWSNDGTRLAITRGYAQHNEDMALAVVPADGSGVGVESDHGLTGCCDTILQWSPNDSTILVMPENLEQRATQHLLLDSSTLAHTPAPWTASNPPAWQRTVR